MRREKTKPQTTTIIGHFRVPPRPLFQNEGRCSAFDTEIIFHSHANKSHFHKNSCAPSLILKVRVFGTRKWPISLWICSLLACPELLAGTQLTFLKFFRCSQFSEFDSNRE